MKVRMHPDDLYDEEEVRELTDYIKSSLESADYYTGRDIDSTLSNVIRSFGRLVDLLAAKGILDVDDVDHIGQYPRIRELVEDNE